MVDAHHLEGENLLSENLERAYVKYIQVFKERLLASGLTVDAAERAEAMNHSLQIEIRPNAKNIPQPISRSGRSDNLTGAFELKELPDDLQSLLLQAYGFPLAVAGISLGAEQGSITLIPQDLLSPVVSTSVSSKAGLEEDVMYPPVRLGSPTTIFTNELRLSLMNGEFFVGTFDAAAIAFHRSQPDLYPPLWTPAKLDPKHIGALALLIMYGESMDQAIYRITLTREGAVPLRDFDREHRWPNLKINKV